MSNSPLEHLCGEVVCVAQISEAHHIPAGLRILDHDDRGNHLKNKRKITFRVDILGGTVGILTINVPVVYMGWYEVVLRGDYPEQGSF